MVNGFLTEANVQINGIVAMIQNGYDKNKNIIENVTPFIGAGVTKCVAENISTQKLIENFNRLKLAPDWLGRDLDSISQYIDSIGGNSRHTVAEYIVDNESEVIQGRDEQDPFWVLAHMPFKLYITTNYDSLLEKYLIDAKKIPSVAISNFMSSDDGSCFIDANELKKEIDALQKKMDTNSDSKSERNKLALLKLIDWPETKDIDVQHPLVFHLHGVATSPESMVLSKDNYIDYLTQLTVKIEPTSVNELGILPGTVITAIKHSNLLFLGYSLKDVNLHVLLRALQVTRSTHELRSIMKPPNSERICQWVLEDGIESGITNGLRDINEFKDKFFAMLCKLQKGKCTQDDLWEEFFGQWTGKLESKKIESRSGEIKKFLANSLGGRSSMDVKDMLWEDVMIVLQEIYNQLKQRIPLP